METCPFEAGDSEKRTVRPGKGQGEAPMIQECTLGRAFGPSKVHLSGKARCGGAVGS